MSTRKPSVNMTLYNTDTKLLNDFIKNARLGDAVTRDYMVLLNLAEDCQFHVDNPQPDLMCFLLPYYLDVMNDYFSCKSQVSRDIFYQFNSAIFAKNYAFRNSLGHENYIRLMNSYIERTVELMNRCNSTVFDWISLFNTAVALDRKNTDLLFKRIFCGVPEVKYSFFMYLSIFLFPESNNIFVDCKKGVGWSNCVWWFYEGISEPFTWHNDSVRFFEYHITPQFIKTIFSQLQDIIVRRHSSEMCDLIKGEMFESLLRGTFAERTKEFLQKIGGEIKDERYWYNY